MACLKLNNKFAKQKNTNNRNMKIKDLIELLEEENQKAKLILEFDNKELSIDEWSIESSDNIVILKLVEK